MPQPLSKVASKAGYTLASSSAYPLRQNEHLARLAMEGISSWADVEFNLLYLYITLAGGEAADAAAVYLALKGDGPKRIVVSTLAERRLAENPEALNVFRAILKLAGRYSADRDKLAHHVWGYSAALPNALLLADPRAVASMVGRAADDRDQIFVYEQKDLEKIIAQNELLAKQVRRFNFVLGGHPANAGGALLQKISAVPEIADMLNPPGQAQQTPPAEGK